MENYIDKEALENIRKTHGRHTQRFEAVLSFVYKYSHSDFQLDDDLKYLFLRCNGQPMQNELYDTVIYEIQVENWSNFSTLEKHEKLVLVGAELYYLQRKLNKCIGRTFYSSSKRDDVLINHIRNEIVQRFSFLQEDLNGIEDYPKAVFSKYYDLYSGNISNKSVSNYGDTSLLIDEIREIFSNRKNNGEKGIFIVDQKTFWLAVTDKRSRSPVSLFTNKMNDDYGRRLYPTKDDLYVFAIALKLHYEEFKKLIEKASEDCGDYTRYSINTGNIRDALIVSVIRDIDGWYKQTKLECESSGEKVHYRDLAMEVLFRVDQILWQNLCTGKKTSQLENLLYHSFLVERNDTLYTKSYKDWSKKNLENFNKKENIIDFQKSVKIKMKEERKKELNKKYYRISTPSAGY